MNIKFYCTNPKKAWEITDEKILYKGKEIPLSTISGVFYHAFKESYGYGWILVICGSGLFAPSYQLSFNKSEIEQAEMVAVQLLKMIGKEEMVNEIIKQSETKKEKEELKKKEEEMKSKEFKKRCNVCGNVFCYTWNDIKKNKELHTHAVLNNVASLAGGFSGNYAAGATSMQTSYSLESQIVDYDKCPSCGSRDLVDITDEEATNNQQATSPTSVADELKNLKELLDMEIITQEEFDAKKKQLLGL